MNCIPFFSAIALIFPFHETDLVEIRQGNFLRSRSGIGRSPLTDTSKKRDHH